MNISTSVLLMIRGPGRLARMLGTDITSLSPRKVQIPDTTVPTSTLSQVTASLMLPKRDSLSRVCVSKMLLGNGHQCSNLLNIETSYLIVQRRQWDHPVTLSQRPIPHL